MLYMSIFKGNFRMCQKSFEGIIKPPPMTIKLYIFKGIFKMMMMMMMRRTTTMMVVMVMVMVMVL